MVTKMIGGLSLYAGSTGHYRFIDTLNMNKFGVEHTGDLGDVILGTYARPTKEGIAYPTGAYSGKMYDKVKSVVEKVSAQYEDEEMYLIYTRGFQGILNPIQITQHFTEACSPFCDVEFMQLCLDIPVEKRISYRVYKHWILNKYPDAANYKWER